jgi:hypothetical protein
MTRLITQERLRKKLKKLEEPDTGWRDVFPAIMGRTDGTVLTGIPGIVWVRNILNGQALTVLNNGVPNRPLIQVEVGRRVDQPGVWQIKGTIEPFSVPSTGGPVIGDHHERHEFPNPDTVWIDRRQIKPLTVLVYNAAGFVVKILGGVLLTANGPTKIATQTVDLSAHVPTTGALFAGIESDDDGAITVNVGTGFAAPGIGTAADMPSPADGKYTRAWVLLYEGQTALSNNDIVVPWVPDFNPTAPGGSLVWGDITGTLSDQTDLQAELDAKQDANADLTAIAGLSPSNDDILQRKAGAWVNRTLAQLITDLTSGLSALFAPIAKGVTNGDSHNHVGGDGAAINYAGVLGTFLNGGTVPASTTHYTCPWKDVTNVTQNQFPWPEGGVLSGMIIRIAGGGQPASGSLVLTLVVNGSDTALVVTIAAGSAGGSYADNVNTVNLAAGDLVMWKIQNNATAASATLTGITMKLTKQTT